MDETTLDDLARENVPVLFDTSAILGYLSEPQPTNLHESHESSVGRVSFMESMTKQIKDKSQFYITTNVQNEMAVPRTDEDYILRWIIKKGYCEGDPILELYRQREIEIRARAELLKAFREEGRVINSHGKREIDNNGERVLNHRERRVYQKIGERFDPLKSRFELADTDFDLLISSLAISIRNRVPVILITNDFGIIGAGRVISDSREEQYNLVKYMSRPLQFSFHFENGYHR